MSVLGVEGAATNNLTSLLQQGLFEEEANRNLDAAIASYQSLATQFDKDRQVAATAVFRLGECYRKLGKTNEAVLQYERIILEFPDQQTLATLSRQNLLGIGVQVAGFEAGSETVFHRRDVDVTQVFAPFDDIYRTLLFPHPVISVHQKPGTRWAVNAPASPMINPMCEPMGSPAR